MAARALLAAAHSDVSALCAQDAPQASMHRQQNIWWELLELEPWAVLFIPGCSGHVASAGGVEVSQKAAVCGQHLHGSRCWGGACSACRYLPLGRMELGWAVRSWRWTGAVRGCHLYSRAPKAVVTWAGCGFARWTRVPGCPAVSLLWLPGLTVSLGLATLPTSSHTCMLPKERGL